jgi:SnoaL-like polyketide cyclase
VYADPVVVNGVAMTITGLVDRAQSLQQAFDRLSMDIIDTVQTPGRFVIAFIMRGRHVGPYLSALGAVVPTHRDIEVRMIDVLTIAANGLISAIWVVSADLALLRQPGAVKLTPSQHQGPLRLIAEADVGHPLGKVRGDIQITRFGAPRVPS